MSLQSFTLWHWWKQTGLIHEYHILPFRGRSYLLSVLTGFTLSSVQLPQHKDATSPGKGNCQPHTGTGSPVKCPAEPGSEALKCSREPDKARLDVAFYILWELILMSNNLTLSFYCCWQWQSGSHFWTLWMFSKIATFQLAPD